LAVAGGGISISGKIGKNLKYILLFLPLWRKMQEARIKRQDKKTKIYLTFSPLEEER
jgi:hypothetical protein